MSAQRNTIRFQRAWATCAHITMMAAVSAFVPALPGQSATPLAGPTQGFVFDAPSASLRQVVGSLGSSVLGPALLSGLDFASAAPQRSYGIGCSAGQCFVITGLGSDDVVQNPIPDPAGVPTGTAWSSDGGTVALYSSTEGWVRVLRQLPGALSAQPQWSTTSFEGTLSAAAVSAGGRHVVLAITGTHAGVYELTESGNFVPVSHAANPIALAFASDGTTLLIADATERTISEVDLDSGLTRSWPIEAVQDAISVQAGRDASGLPVVYIVGRSDRTLFAYDAKSHELTAQVPLSFAPTGLQALSADSYQLTSRLQEDDLLWSFTVGRGVYFVPVTPAESTTRTENAQRRVRR